MSTNEQAPWTILDMNFFSIYVDDMQAAVKFYSKVFGPPGYREGEIRGWKMGATWFTILPGSQANAPGRNPRNCEIALQVGTRREVDNLYKALVDAGAEAGWTPEDTEMYVPMHYGYVNDPFGVRFDVYCMIENGDQ